MPSPWQTFSRRSRTTARLLSVALLASAGAPALAAPAADEPQVEISDAWIRWLPAGLPAGGYATLHNSGTRPLLVVGASSPDYAQVSLHQSRELNGVSMMQPVAQITLPAGGSLRFSASGYHMMLESPTRTLHPGDHVAITLHFAGGKSETASFELRKPDAQIQP